MKTVTARDAAKKFGALLDAAEGGPVTISKSGRPRAVILSARDFANYAQAYDKAQDEKLVAMTLKTLELIKAGKLGASDRALALIRRMRLDETRPGDERAAAGLLAKEVGP